VAKVDFYVLDEVDEHARYTLACKLAEKAWRLHNTIHIHTMNSSDASRLDTLLWTFRDGSFVPHALVGADTDAPISIGYGDNNVPPRDLLISLCDDVPPFADSFARIAELVTAEEQCKQKGRTRFAHYREQGHTMDTHKL
jgi:DNA polymerase-3 subunit chi